MAPRYSSLVERKFVLVAEHEFPDYVCHDSEKELQRDLLAGKKEKHMALNRRTKQPIQDVIRRRRTKTSRGIRTQENAVLIVLRKAVP
jgi:hypothetical protein